MILNELVMMTFAHFCFACLGLQACLLKEKLINHYDTEINHILSRHSSCTLHLIMQLFLFLILFHLIPSTPLISMLPRGKENCSQKFMF